MKNCQVCGKANELKKFGAYCSEECRDSDLAILGKTCNCGKCGEDFKSLEKKSFCLNCSALMNKTKGQINCSQGKKVSPFIYSIFQDNIDRILVGSNSGDSVNCSHASHVIIETADESFIPEIVKLAESSNDKAQIWFKDILNKLMDKNKVIIE